MRVAREFVERERRSAQRPCGEYRGPLVSFGPRPTEEVHVAPGTVVPGATSTPLLGYEATRLDGGPLEPQPLLRGGVDGRCEVLGERHVNDLVGQRARHERQHAGV